MKRQFIFRHYWWISLVVAIVGVSLSLGYWTSAGASLLVPSIVAPLGFCYFVQRQKLAEITLFKDLFTEFNERYDDMNGDLGRIADAKALEKPEDRQIVVDYINLCGEEYLFFSEGYIHQEAWRSWCAGMMYYFEREPFRAVLAEEFEVNSYYGLSLEIIESSAS